MKARWALFISGRGSNAQAVLDLSELARVSLVVCSQANAWGLARAQRQGIPTLVLPKKVDWTQVDLELKERRINKIFLLGFMRMVPAGFVEQWQGRIWNLHPSLLPQFPGLHAIEKSYESRQAMGVTIHAVTAEMDAGERLLQIKSVPQMSAELSSEVSAERSREISLSRAQELISRDEQRAVRYFFERRSI